MNHAKFPLTSSDGADIPRKEILERKSEYTLGIGGVPNEDVMTRVKVISTALFMPRMMSRCDLRCINKRFTFAKTRNQFLRISEGHFLLHLYAPFISIFTFTFILPPYLFSSHWAMLRNSSHESLNRKHPIFSMRLAGLFGPPVLSPHTLKWKLEGIIQPSSLTTTPCFKSILLASKLVS